VINSLDLVASASCRSLAALSRASLVFSCSFFIVSISAAWVFLILVLPPSSGAPPALLPVPTWRGLLAPSAHRRPSSAAPHSGQRGRCWHASRGPDPQSLRRTSWSVSRRSWASADGSRRLPRNRLRWLCDLPGRGRRERERQSSSKNKREREREHPDPDPGAHRRVSRLVSGESGPSSDPCSYCVHVRGVPRPPSRKSGAMCAHEKRERERSERSGAGAGP
jgi:hypothetical protein